MLSDESINWKKFSVHGKQFIIFSSMIILGCASSLKEQGRDNFFKVIGASRDSDVYPCADYAARRNYMGEPYYIRVPETGKVIARHEGMDFCSLAGVDVLSPASGVIVDIVEDNPYRGGSVTLQTSIAYDHYQTGNLTYKLFVQALHIMPNKNLMVGSKVNAGDVIGRIQPPNRPEIGSRPHVHLAAGAGPDVWNLHTDPNQFWQKGPGRVSCYNPSDPPSEQHLVAPIRCFLANKK